MPGIPRKALGKAKGRNLPFSSTAPCPVQLHDARAALKGLCSSLTSCVWPLCWGREGCWTGSTGRKTSHSSRQECANSTCSFLSFFLIFFFPQEGQLPIFPKAKLSAGLTFLLSFEHYNYYLIFQNNTVAEILMLRMHCFSVSIQPAVWIFFPCFYTTEMLCYLHAFESFSFRNLPQLPSAGDFIQSHEHSWPFKVSPRLSEWQKNKLGSDLILFLSRGLFTCLGAWGIARDRPEGVHSPGCASCARQCCCLILEKLDD